MYGESGEIDLGELEGDLMHDLTRPNALGLIRRTQIRERRYEWLLGLEDLSMVPEPLFRALEHDWTFLPNTIMCDFRSALLDAVDLLLAQYAAGRHDEETIADKRRALTEGRVFVASLTELQALLLVEALQWRPQQAGHNCSDAYQQMVSRHTAERQDVQRALVLAELDAQGRL